MHYTGLQHFAFEAYPMDPVVRLPGPHPFRRVSLRRGRQYILREFYAGQDGSDCTQVVVNRQLESPDQAPAREALDPMESPG